MVASKPQIIGIVGGSCAGKTWLASRLHGLLEGSAALLSQDDFYRDRSYLSPGRRTLVNFDHPKAIDWERLEEVLVQFSTGAGARVPRYDFKTHGRLAQESMVSPTPIIIVEGLWLFRRPALRKYFNLKVYIRSSKDWCVSRRLDRDVRERGRSERDVREQLDRFTLPMFERFVEPQERWADVVVEAPVNEEFVLHLREQLTTKLNSVGI